LGGVGEKVKREERMGWRVMKRKKRKGKEGKKKKDARYLRLQATEYGGGMYLLTEALPGLGGHKAGEAQG
jgi:hypothetical protein